MNFQGVGGAQLIPRNFQCRSGLVNLFRFIQAPPPGSIIGTVTTRTGEQIPLVQTQPTPLGGISLASVDGQVANLCGVFVRVSGQTALDVRVVNPGVPSPTGTPTPVNLRELLILLLLLLLFGGQGVNLRSVNLRNIDLNQLLASPQAQAVLGQAGISPQDVATALSTFR